MKVKIQQRSVYHKFAEVEIEIPDLIDKESEVHEYLIEHEDLYVDKIDKAISEANWEYGIGCDEYRGMNEPESSSEWRFECEELELGGHL